MYEMRWLDVAPSTHVFDVALVDLAIEAIVQRAAPTRDRDTILLEVGKVLASHFGTWTEGWGWSANSGGPVRGYCCPSHSILPDMESEPEPTIHRIRSAIVDWRMFLEQLEALFAEVHAKSLPPAPAMEHAAPRLFHLVTERTHFEDAWYATFKQAVTWFAETIVYDVARVCELVDAAIEGRFESWTGPTKETRQAVFATLARDAESLASGPSIDGTNAWMRIRPTAFAALPDPPLRRPVERDGHERYIMEQDHARDLERSSRMASALALCRDAAMHRLPLAFDLLAEWQAIVLGESAPVPFRTEQAFAKAGREHYPIGMLTSAKFASLLAGANDASVPVAIRAARVYLDICFFHPFPDGNARAARLALDHVLTREGLALHEARGVFSLSRAAGDARGAWSLAAAIDRLAGPRTSACL